MNFFKDFQGEIKTFLIVVVVVGIITVGGILLLKAMQSVPVVQTSPPVLSPQPQPPASSDFTLSGVEGWQTYRNEEFGFEVKYPAVYEVGYNPKYPETISLGERNEYGVREPNIFITIMEEPTMLGFQGTWGVMLRTGLDQHVVYSENVEVDGQSFEKEKWSQGPTGITAYTIRDQLTYTLLVGFTDEESAQKETLLFDQILSTFRFVE